MPAGLSLLPWLIGLSGGLLRINATAAGLDCLAGTAVGVAILWNPKGRDLAETLRDWIPAHGAGTGHWLSAVQAVLFGSLLVVLTAAFLPSGVDALTVSVAFAAALGLGAMPERFQPWVRRGLLWVGGVGLAVVALGDAGMSGLPVGQTAGASPAAQLFLGFAAAALVVAAVPSLANGRPAAWHRSLLGYAIVSVGVEAVAAFTAGAFGIGGESVKAGLLAVAAGWWWIPGLALGGNSLYAAGQGLAQVWQRGRAIWAPAGGFVGWGVAAGVAAGAMIGHLGLVDQSLWVESLWAAMAGALAWLDPSPLAARRRRPWLPGAAGIGAGSVGAGFLVAAGPWVGSGSERLGGVDLAPLGVFLLCGTVAWATAGLGRSPAEAEITPPST